MRGVSSGVVLALVVLALALAIGSWTLLAGGVRDTQSDVANGAATRPVTSIRDAESADRRLFRIDSSRRAAAAASPTDPEIPITISRDAALAAARSGTLDIELPDGVRYPVHYERSENAPGGNWTFVGRVDTAVGDLGG